MAIPAPAKQYRDELRRLPIEVLQQKHKQTMDALIEAIRRKNEADEASAFYNQPNAKADFDHWSKSPYWTLEEGVALSLGREPKRVNSQTLKDFGSRDIARNYEQRLDLAKRSVFVKLLGQTNIPGFFLGWAQRNEMAVPDELVRLVTQRGQPVADWPTLVKEANERTAQTLEWAKKSNAEALEVGQASFNEALAMWSAQVKERDESIDTLKAEIERLRSVSRSPAAEAPLNAKSRASLLKLLLGMAIDGYGYDPRAEKSPTTKELVDVLAGLGISIDDNTVRNWLKEAAETIEHISPIRRDEGN